MLLPIKQLALSAPLIALLFCLTACNKKEVEKPSSPKIEVANIEQQVIHTTVGEEFFIETHQPLYPSSWYLLNYEAMDKCVEFVRQDTRPPRETSGSELVVGEGHYQLWVFRAIAPGKQRILMADMFLDGDFPVLSYLETLVEVAPAEKKPDVNEQVRGHIEKRTIETTVGKEFGVEVDQPVAPASWHLLVGDNPQNDPINFARIDVVKDDPYAGLEGHMRRERWVFRATKPGEHTILMALVGKSWQYGGYLEVRVLVKP